MDVKLAEKLGDELPGIFNWAMVGYNRLKENNYIFSTGISMANAKNDYKRLSNNIYEFIEEHIIPSSPDARITLKDAFLLYQKKCNEMNYTQRSRKDFKTAIINSGYRIGNSTRDANQVCIFGVELAG
jgi:putative DNA primase/helicase